MFREGYIFISEDQVTRSHMSSLTSSDLLDIRYHLLCRPAEDLHVLVNQPRGGHDDLLQHLVQLAVVSLVCSAHWSNW